MKKRFYLIFISILMAGCLVGPKYSRPKLENPEAYKQASAKTDSITNFKWWEVYNDSALQSLIRISLDQNRDLRIAIARIEQSKAILGFNKANLGPSLDYSARARATDFKPAAESSNLAFNGPSVSVIGNVNWELDLWGKLRHANRAAYAELLASEEDRKSIQLSLVAEVAELYFQMRGMDERLDITRKTTISREEYLRIISARFEKGEVAELDKLQAEQLAASSKAQEFVLERTIIFAENAINVLLGRSSTELNRGFLNGQQQLPLDIPSGLPSQLLERRPDIRAAEQRLISQTEKIGMAVALRFPSLSLTGFLGIASNSLSTLGSTGSSLTSFTGGVSGPFFHFNQNVRRVEAEKAAAVQFSNVYEQTVLQAFAEVENSLAEVRTYSSEFTARQRQVNATQKTLMLSRSLYDNGYVSFLQVLDSEREFYDSQFQMSLTVQDQLIATVRLYKALGGGW